MVKIESLSHKLRNKAKMSALITSIQHCIGSVTAITQRKEINGSRNGKEESEIKLTNKTICRWHDHIMEQNLNKPLKNTIGTNKQVQQGFRI